MGAIGIRFGCVVLALGAAAPAAAAAQASVELTPVVGLYLPTADVFAFTDPTGSTTVSLGHKSAYALGGRLALHVSPRVAVEGSVIYSPSDLKAEITGVAGASESASIVMLDARVRYRIGGARQGTAYHLSGGLAYVLRGGRAWSDFENGLQSGGIDLKGKNDFGALIGAGVTLPMGGRLALRADLEDHLYFGKFTLSGAGVQLETESKMQNDLRLTLGLVIPVGGK